MPRYDPDTIAALAEGRLDSEEAARLEREIANDPAARAELEAHRTALAALGAAPALLLTEIERAGLRASVADTLGLAQPAAATTPTTRRVPWGSLGIAAAALFGLVAVVPVVGLLNTGGDDAADTALAPVATSREATPETDVLDTDTATEELAAAIADGSFEASPESDGAGAAGFGSTTSAPVSTTTSSLDETTTTTTAAAEGATTSTEATTTEPTGTEPTMEQLVADLTAIWEDTDAVKEIAVEAIEEDTCWVEDGESRESSESTDPETGRWTFEYIDGDWTVVIYFQYDADGVPGPFDVYEISDCGHLMEIPEPR